MQGKEKASPSAKLEALKAQINDSHQRCVKALRTSLGYARQTGNQLIEAKGLVERQGDPWIPWVQENCKFSISEAQRYMRIADRYGELLAQCNDPDSLTMIEALKLLSPKKKDGTSGHDGPDLRFPVFSEAEVNDRAMDAAQLQFEDDSPQEKFVREKAGLLARQVLGLARRSKCKDSQGQAVDPALVAIALIQQLKKALQLSLVVRTDPPEASDTQPKAKASDGGHKPTNRLNGMAAATSR